MLAARRAAGGQVVLVSSGAIAAGLGPLGLAARPRDLATQQAAASVGQGLLVAHYTAAFARHGLQVGQVLLTADDTVRRVHYRNAHRALTRLLDLGIVPVINENDAVATDEIRFGDNDRLAALVSHLVHADALLLLSDVDSLYTGPPSRDGSRRIASVVDAQDLEGIDVASRGSAVGTGGMVTKLESVAIATQSGVPVVLTSAAQAAQALAGEDVGTWFTATGRRTSIRRLWLAHAAQHARTAGARRGAVRAVVERGTSLLPAGVTGCRGDVRGGRPGRARRAGRRARGARARRLRRRRGARRCSAGRRPTCARSWARATTASWSTATTWSWSASAAETPATSALRARPDRRECVRTRGVGPARADRPVVVSSAADPGLRELVEARVRPELDARARRCSARGTW